MRSLVIIPAFNEEGNIKPLLEKISSLNLEGLDVLIVDDHSEDGTSHCVREAAGKYQRVKMISSESSQHGLAHCYRSGFSFCLENNYDSILCMDADLSHDPKDIPGLLAALNEADWVIGSRYCKGGSDAGLTFARRILSRLANWYIRKKLNVPIADMTGGFNCFRVEVLKKIGISSIVSRGFVFQVEVKCRALREGFRMKEIPIEFHHRYAGKSKFSLGIVFEAIKSLNEL